MGWWCWERAENRTRANISATPLKLGRMVPGATPCRRSCSAAPTPTARELQRHAAALYPPLFHPSTPPDRPRELRAAKNAAAAGSRPGFIAAAGVAAFCIYLCGLTSFFSPSAAYRSRCFSLFVYHRSLNISSQFLHKISRFSNVTYR